MIERLPSSLTKKMGKEVLQRVDVPIAPLNDLSRREGILLRGIHE